MKRILFFSLLVFQSLITLADEGMWLPQLLQALNEKDMRKRGLKLKAEDIYSINKSSLKDAIVSLGGFCTAEVISDNGLILTNHHCGFDAIQNHSSLEHNYLKDGFWAASHGAELTNPGLTATFIIRIEEVTSAILKGIEGTMSEKERAAAIDKNMGELKSNYKKENYQDILVRSFFDGNKYFLFVTETYKDVRLVGAPPSSIGNFGKDTDNWMWPRHTGDFSLFRIYAGKDNKPADYSPDNIPYQPRRSLSISLKGMKEGDFTMVFGFPGRTMEYLPKVAVEQIMTMNDLARIGIRDKALTIMDGFMRKDEAIKIKYAAKYANVQNAYKKWKGEVLGLTSKNALAKKETFENEFRKRMEANPEVKKRYGNPLADLSGAYEEFKPYSNARDYYSEIMPRIELFSIAATLINFVTALEKDGSQFEKLKTEAADKCNAVFNEFDVRVDHNLFEALMEKYAKDQKPEFVSPLLLKEMQVAGSWAQLAKSIYDRSLLVSEESVNALLNGSREPIVEKIKNDPALLLYKDIIATYNEKAAQKIGEIQPKITKAQRAYMAAQMELFPERKFYPDANSTLRITYGNVKGYRPKDGVKYNYYTYLDGVMEKYVPGDYEFDLPKKLISLYEKKDFGPYGVNGRQPVCFIGSNHTTGGNSGSPALNAKGELVGLNFDRVWEGTMSDINYDADICRNVMVDIRYVLFIIDKFADAKNIISELKIVRK